MQLYNNYVLTLENFQNLGSQLLNFQLDVAWSLGRYRYFKKLFKVCFSS